MKIFEDDTEDGLRLCWGGPMDGRPLYWRPRRGKFGVLLIDKPSTMAYVYLWDYSARKLRVNSMDKISKVDMNPDRTDLDLVAMPS